MCSDTTDNDITHGMRQAPDLNNVLDVLCLVHDACAYINAKNQVKACAELH